MQLRNVFLIFLLLIVAALAFAFVEYLPRPSVPMACTEEAKLCPDGSYVGRTGPACAFAPCPSGPDTSTWLVATSTTGYTLRYPQTLSTEYIRAVDWPPVFTVMNESFSCTEAGIETDRAGETELRLIGGRAYCVTTISEGAAGSVYLQYAYAFPAGTKTHILTFTLRAVQCGNYDEPQKTACETERTAFTIDPLLDQIARTISE